MRMWAQKTRNLSMPWSNATGVGEPSPVTEAVGLGHFWGYQEDAAGGQEVDVNALLSWRNWKGDCSVCS